MSLSDREYVEKMETKINVLVAVFSNYLFNEDAKQHYVSTLIAYKDNPYLFKVMDKLANGNVKKFPFIQDIIDGIAEETRRNPPVNEPEKRLEQPKDKPFETKQSAILSIMWLYYTKFYKASDFATSFEGSLLINEFTRMYPGESFSVKKLELEFPRERVEKWMENQK